jgi:hypothetical protein
MIGTDNKFVYLSFLPEMCHNLLCGRRLGSIGRDERVVNTGCHRHHYKAYSGVIRADLGYKGFKQYSHRTWTLERRLRNIGDEVLRRRIASWIC